MLLFFLPHSPECFSPERSLIVKVSLFSCTRLEYTALIILSCIKPEEVDAFSGSVGFVTISFGMGSTEGWTSLHVLYLTSCRSLIISSALFYF